MAAEVAEKVLAAENSPENKHVDEKDTVPTDTIRILANGHDLEHQATQDLAREKDPGIQAPEEEDVSDNDPPAGGDSHLDDGGGDRAVGNDGGAIFPDEEEDPELRKTLKLFLFTGMITMLLLMTTNTMTPLMDEFNMKVMSHTGGLHSILRYDTKAKMNHGDTPDHPVNRKTNKRNNEGEDVLTEETTNRSPDEKITSKIPKDGVINKKMVKWEYDKPPNDDNASENKDEEEDVHKPNLDVGKHEQIHDRDDLHHQQPRNQRSIQHPIRDDPVVEAPAAVHGGVPDVQAGEDTPDKGRQNEGAGEDDATVQAGETDDDHDNTNDKVVVGPEVPREMKGEKMTLNRLSAMHESTYQEDVKN